MEKIKLLDNKQYNKKDLLKKMLDDDFYYGELSSLALSSSSIKLLYESPKKYHYVNKYGKETQGLRDGWLLHCLLLEPEKFDEQIFLDVQSKNTKAYKEAVENTQGRVFTAKEKSDAERLADAILKNEQALQLLTDCEYEVPAIGMVNDYPFRGKADVLCSDKITDIKTCADIRAFPFQAKKYGYDIQVYIYCTLFNLDFFEFRFLVVDKSTLDVGIFEVSEDFYFSGMEKVKKGIAMFETYFLKEEIDVNDYIITGTL